MPHHQVSARDLPSGTVTLLFSDIEGSTGLLHELGDAYAEGELLSLEAVVEKAALVA